MTVKRKYRWLSRSMLWGGVYDAIFGLPILLIPSQTGAFINIACPANPFYVRFCGLFLLILALGYFIAWRNIEGNLGLVRMMIVSRSMGFIFMGGFAIFGALGKTFIALAVGDFLFALLHFIFYVKKV